MESIARQINLFGHICSTRCQFCKWKANNSQIYTLIAKKKFGIDSYHYQDTNENKGTVRKVQIDALKKCGLKTGILSSTILIVSACVSGQIM